MFSKMAAVNQQVIQKMIENIKLLDYEAEFEYREFEVRNSTKRLLEAPMEILLNKNLYFSSQ